MDDVLLTARIVAKANEYLDFPSVVGHETPFLDHIARDFEGLGLGVARRRNLTVVDTGRPGPIYCAHVDRHGGVVDADGRIRFAANAVKWEKYSEEVTPSSEFVARLHARYRGEEMFAYDRTTGGRIAYGDVAEVALDPEGGRALIELEGLPPIPPGTPVAFSRAVDRDADERLSGQLDNPLSIAILRIAAETGLRGRLVFAAEEEIGRSAAHILGWLGAEIGPCRELVVVDTSPFDTTEEADAGAVVLRRRDANGAFDPAMTARLDAAAAHVGAPVVYKDAYIDAANKAARKTGPKAKGYGMTELGRIVALTNGEVTGSTLQIPTSNYHTNREETSLRAVLNAARVVLAL